MRKGETVMKMLAINPIPLKKRIKEFLFDYLFILAYLVFLLLGSMLIYMILFHGVPEFTEIQSQWLVFFTSVLPITLLFTFLDYKNDGSFGKVKAGLELVYQKKTVQASLIRNAIKFLPWQLGHMGTIHGFYSNFDVLFIVLSISATLLAVLLLAMTMFRKDKRHLGDLLAHTQVQLKKE
ncbi:RDD family protein [Streptococcus parasanguinis]